MLQVLNFDVMAEVMVARKQAAACSATTYLRDSTGYARLNPWRLRELAMRDAAASTLTSFMVHFKRGASPAAEVRHRPRCVV